MKVIDPGHAYELDSLDGPFPCALIFVKRIGKKYPGNSKRWSGTNSQEVFRALLDRAHYLQHQIPCIETKISILFIMLCIWLYEIRAARRHHRRWPGLRKSVYGITCPQCGHVSCSTFLCKEIP